jgi:hypothetical protein
VPPLESYNKHYMIGQFVSLFYIKKSYPFELIMYGVKMLLYANAAGFAMVEDFCDKVL